MISFLVSLILASMGGAMDCPAPREDEAATVYIIKHAWHAGIAIPWKKMDEHGYPALDEFEEGAYVEVGWGDANYYPNPDPGILTTLRAGLWPTPSALHVAVLSSNPTEYFRRTEVLHFPVSSDALGRLISYISEAHELDDGRTVPTEQGLYAESYFFAGWERYHVFNNCNHWVARALELATCDIDPSRTMTVEQLLSQIRRFAE